MKGMEWAENFFKDEPKRTPEEDEIYWATKKYDKEIDRIKSKYYNEVQFIKFLKYKRENGYD